MVATRKEVRPGEDCVHDRQGASNLVNVTQRGLLDALMFDHLAEYPTISATDDEHLLGVRMRVHGEVRDHLLVPDHPSISVLEPVPRFCILVCSFQRKTKESGGAEHQREFVPLGALNNVVQH